MKVIATGFLIGLLLSACGLVQTEESDEELKTSKLAYESCLRSTIAETNCYKEKAIYETDLAEYEARQRALSHYGASSVTVNSNR